MKKLRNNHYIHTTIAMSLVLGLSLTMFTILSQPRTTHNTQAQQNFQTSIAAANFSEDDQNFNTESSNAINHGNALHVPILMYHHIGFAPATADATHKGLTISPTEFETQVKWLKDHGYESVSVDALYGRIKNASTSWPSKPVIFTFDDGYTDVFENAVPILKKYGYTGTFAVITSFPGQTQGDNFYATWEQIVGAKHAGMEIICHTQNHFDGSSSKFNEDYIYQNLAGCQNDLKRHLGSTLPYLVYPYGHFTPTYITQAEKAGFVMGLTVTGGSYINPNDLMHTNRVRINPNQSLEKFAEKLNS